LSALWRWAEHEKLVECNILRDVEPPKPEEREIVPLTQADVKALLAACDRTRAYDRPGKRRCDNTRPTGLRDRAILLLLIDTGLRASELCELRIHQADLKNHRVTVMGKGSKERLVPMSPRTAQSLWRYLATRPDAKPVNYLFITGQDTPFDRTSLRRLVYRIGERAGVNNVHPHRFRHTFGRPFGRLVNISLDMARCQERASSPWRLRGPSNSGPVSFQGT
jgi:integrase/recombinase XerD